MAVRNPTTFKHYQDINGFLPRKEIITTTPNSIIDDQVYCLDGGQLVFSDCHYPIKTTCSPDTGYGYFYGFENILKRMSSVFPAETHINTRWGVYLWTDAATTSLDVRLSAGTFASPTVNSDLTVNANLTTPLWRAQTVSALWLTDEELIFELTIRNANPKETTVILGGLYIYCLVT
jgi:hypothetical protein